MLAVFPLISIAFGTGNMEERDYGSRKSMSSLPHSTRTPTNASYYTKKCFMLLLYKNRILQKAQCPNKQKKWREPRNLTAESAASLSA